MKKLLIILLMLSIPVYVMADSCNNGNVSISSIELVEKNENTRELEEPKINGNNLILNLVMAEVGDKIEYKIVVKNDSNDNFKLDNNSLILDSNYIDYSLESEDKSNIVNANSSKVFNIKLEYKNKVSDDSYVRGSYRDNKTMNILLTNDKGILDLLVNPNTGFKYYFFLIIVLFVIGLSYILIKKKKINKFTIIIFLMFIIIPIRVNSLCRTTIDINCNIKILKNYYPCTTSDVNEELLPGMEYNKGQYTYIYKKQRKLVWEDDGYSLTTVDIDADGWSIILGYDYYEQDKNIPICTTINGKPIVSTSNMFTFKDIDNDVDFSTLDASEVTDMSYMFFNSKINNIDLEGILSELDTSKVKDMSHMFSFFYTNASIDLSKLDTSNVKKMNGFLFYTKLDNFNVTNLDTSKVEDMDSMFDGSSANQDNYELDLSNWNTSNVKNMNCLFSGAFMRKSSIINISNWDTSKVEDMSSMFRSVGSNADSITIIGLSDLNTSNVTNMAAMFEEFAKNSSHCSFGNLSNLDTSKVILTNRLFMNAMQQIENVYDVGTIDIYSSNINELFRYSPNIKATINIHNPIENHFVTFSGGATKPGAEIIVNYSNKVTNIDDIIATKSDNSNIIKGSIID